MLEPVLSFHYSLLHNYVGSVCFSDGGKKCGLMICAYNAVEKMKAEQEVDVYNSALMARYRRPQFISSLVCVIL